MKYFDDVLTLVIQLSFCQDKICVYLSVYRLIFFFFYTTDEFLQQMFYVELIFPDHANRFFKNDFLTLVNNYFDPSYPPEISNLWYKIDSEIDDLLSESDTLPKILSLFFLF
ncbi:hypothetical protein KUTeg_003266 [Tegillarca granosa]|uniref:Uncharacterized protein n=1 Tax=Tegillarca granosa TaxID=220873 RepID=A0ABQ9FPK7_TEGGR|nr:hypothetical protein KUTeg_003266 [Tegillarca granosa]